VAGGADWRKLNKLATWTNENREKDNAMLSTACVLSRLALMGYDQSIVKAILQSIFILCSGDPMFQNGKITLHDMHYM
jgi:hypothetical protein